MLASASESHPPMSKTAESSVSVPAGFAKPGEYTLSSELARLSLPAEYRDAYRTLAWVNSICFLFLIVGILGLKAPQVIVKPLSEPIEPMPLVQAPPDEAPKPQPEQIKPDEPEPTDAPVDTPQVVTIVAAVETPNLVFPVPVEGAIAISTEARFVPAPPPKIAAPPKPTQFDPNSTTGGIFPDPIYPAFAQRNRQQGTVVLEFTVDASGAVTSVKVQKTSGFNILDEAAVKAVKERWRFPPGGARYYFNKFTFELK